MPVPYRIRIADLQRYRLNAYGTFIAYVFRQRKTEKNLAFRSLFIIHQRRFTMLQKMTRTNEKGFTLIELMIVIAIIGILAAIAIPNFIAYRNKAFCSAAESDGNGIAAAISDYFAIPSHTSTPALADLNTNQGYRLSGNPVNVGAILGADPNVNITVTVVDSSTRCPADYRTGMTAAISPKGFWAGGTYTKLIAF
jgi:type IV pilus assembly protein PilA